MPRRHPKGKGGSSSDAPAAIVVTVEALERRELLSTAAHNREQWIWQRLDR